MLIELDAVDANHSAGLNLNFRLSESDFRVYR